MITFYILISYGAKSSGSFRDHLQYLTQREAYDQLLARYPTHEGKIFGDYAREIRGLDQLPNLKALLLACKKEDVGLVFIDDLRRIFRYTEKDCRRALLSELREFEQHLHSVKHRRKLSAFSEALTDYVLEQVDRVKLPRQKMSNRDTSMARAASIISRSKRSRALSLQIDKLRTEFMAVNGTPTTYQDLANKANSSGLRTSTGKE